MTRGQLARRKAGLAVMNRADRRAIRFALGPMMGALLLVVGASSRATPPLELHCDDWTRDAQCLSNPAFMLTACATECSHNLMDLAGECGEWASLDECERNAKWMSLNCNKSCMAKINGRQPGVDGLARDGDGDTSSPSPSAAPSSSPQASAAGRPSKAPRLEGEDASDQELAEEVKRRQLEAADLARQRQAQQRYTASRQAYPITGSVAYRTLPVTFTLMLIALTAIRQRRSGKAAAKGAIPLQPPLVEALPARLRPFLERLYSLQVMYMRMGGPPLDVVGRALVGMYYVNEAVAYGEEVRIDLFRFNFARMFRSVQNAFDFFQLFLPAIVSALVLGRGSAVVSSMLMVDVIKDVISVGSRVVNVYMNAGLFYVNELMIKKLSMLGCTLLMVASSIAKKDGISRSKSRSHSGMLLSDGLQASDISVGGSLLLLMARVRVDSG